MVGVSTGARKRFAIEAMRVSIARIVAIAEYALKFTVEITLEVVLVVVSLIAARLRSARLLRARLLRARLSLHASVRRLGLEKGSGLAMKLVRLGFLDELLDSETLVERMLAPAQEAPSDVCFCGEGDGSQDVWCQRRS